MGSVAIFLNAVEARVLGALVEKEITTPEYYPLSLNALVNACNQKNNREPVMNLDEDAVREALRGLEDDGLAEPRRGRQGDEVRASSAGGIQLHSRRDGGDVRAAAARAADSGRAAGTHGKD